MLHHIISSSCKILPKSVGANSNVSKECGCHGTHGTHSDEGPVVCSGSFYLNKTRQMTNNVLAMFQDSKTSKLVQFNCVEKIRVNLPQEVLKIQIVDIDGNVQNINGLAVVDICGKVSDRLAAI